MKAKAIGLFALVLLLAAPAGAGTNFHDKSYSHSDSDSHTYTHSHNSNHSFNFRTFRSWDTGDAHWRLKDDGILITNTEDRDERVWVTENGELYVNDRQVQLQPEQQANLKEFRDLTYEVSADAKQIAREGVRIGLKGAGLGIKAVGGVLKLLLTGYSEDDLERDMDAEAAKLEVWADALEKKADLVEEKADRMEELGLQLKEEIPELRELDWL